MRKHTALRLIGVFLLFVVLASALFIVVGRLDGQQEQQRGVLNEDIGRYKRIDYEGRRFVRKDNMDLVLIIGVDQTEGSVRKGYRSGGQADFLMLLAIDHNAKQVRTLHIDRDTMTNITVLGVLGQKVGTNYAQICLSHGFGATEEENSAYAMEAVENLLQGEKIDFYLSTNIDAIAQLNDALGGVTVTLNEDLTHLDPAMALGKVLTLHGMQAEYFVRNRYNIADGSNAKRMERQRIYMDALSVTMKQKMQADENFVNTFMNDVWDLLTSNVTLGRVTNVFSNAVNYRILPVEYLSGEHVVGKDGFMEYHVQEDDTVKWVLSALYREE